MTLNLECLSARAQSQRLFIATLVASYPSFLERADGNELVWKDGTRMPIDDGLPAKGFETLLNNPDIEDQFRIPYPLGRLDAPPPVNSDPGRIRYAPLWEKMYGKCADGEVEERLVEIDWLPHHARQKLKVTSVNGVAEKLKAVSQELERLPSRFLKFLQPSAGTYNCRRIAGTQRASPHGYGIAIDINTHFADYWRWHRKGAKGTYSYKNRIPHQIIEIFEKHGFIWGGKWYHYDTMHFEYRPELISFARARAGRNTEPTAAEARGSR